MEIWTVAAIIAGVSVCLLSHLLARRGTGSSEAAQSNAVGSGGEQQPIAARHTVQDQIKSWRINS